LPEQNTTEVRRKKIAFFDHFIKNEIFYRLFFLKTHFSTEPADHLHRRFTLTPIILQNGKKVKK